MSSFRRLLQVQMPDTYELVRGKKVVTAAGEIVTILASVQPPTMNTYNEIKVDLGGVRIDYVILVTTSPEYFLPVHDPKAETEPCYFMWQGFRYKNCFPREGLAGVIPHMQYWAVRELEE